MATEKKEKKGFFKEFGEFISRGNVLDLAVGVIIGGAFSAIVTALTNNILQPIINFILAAILGAKGLDGIYTFLKTAYVPDALGEPTSVVDLSNSIYIDWGAFINAVINFLLIALVLFLIIKVINRVRKAGEEAKANYEKAKAEKLAAKEAKEVAENGESVANAAEGETAPTSNDDE